MDRSIDHGDGRNTTILPLSHHVKADTNTVSQTSQAENDLDEIQKKNQWNWR